MNNIFNAVKKILVYHEPKDTDGFELLETDYEGTDIDGFDDSMDINIIEKNNDVQPGKDEGNKGQSGKGKSKKNNSSNKESSSKTPKDNEAGENTNNDNLRNNGSHKNDKGNSRSIKTKLPLKIDEWNESKKKEEKNSDSNDRPEEQKNSTGSKNSKDSEHSKGSEGSTDSKDSKGSVDSKDSKDSEDSNGANDSAGEEKVSKQLDINYKKMQKEFVSDKNSDIILRKFIIGKKYNAFIVFIDGMVDRDTINNFILRQLMLPELFKDMTEGDDFIKYIEENVLSVHDTKEENVFEMVIRQVLNGLTALFVEGCENALLFETRGYEKRNVSRPITENVIRGSQEGFTENLRTNITLIRRIVKNNRFVTEIIPIGKENNSHCGILYIEGITNPKVIKEVKRRIGNLDIDFISGDGMLEQLIEDRPFMIFPQVLRTERPDRAAYFLMNGKVVIVVDGTPFIIAVPTCFFNMLQSSEDTNMKWQFATVLRNIRSIGLLISIILPGAYIALTLYHQEMIPTDLLIAIAQSRENVPFPVVVETILMELSFELIREAGVRVPGIIGTTLGIIGALILGQAAVAAGIVSPILIIVVAVTGLGNFTSPDVGVSFSIRILRFGLIALGALAGFYGISVGLFIIVGALCNTKSFGVPILAPIAPKTKGKADVFIRSPYGQYERDDYLNTLKRNKASKDPRKWAKK